MGHIRAVIVFALFAAGCAATVAEDGMGQGEATLDGGMPPPGMGTGGTPAAPFVPQTGGSPAAGGATAGSGGVGGAEPWGGSAGEAGSASTGGVAATGGTGGTGGTVPSGGTAGTGAVPTAGAGGVPPLFPDPVDVTTLAASPDNPAECPDVAPENPVGDCLGLPIYLNCVWADERRTYSCVCDWYHWLCI